MTSTKTKDKIYKKDTLQALHIAVAYDKKLIIEDLNLVIPKNKISVIIGSNGCGKSTLLKTMARLLKLRDGKVMLGNEDIHKMQTKELAKQVGLLPQTSVTPEGIRVSDLVSRGRFPYQKLLGGMQKEDLRAVQDAMDMMGITALMDQSVEELSGGQRQRVWIAMALAQQTDILLLDEPTTYLDVKYQIEILDLLMELNHRFHTTIVMVLHDINLAARYSDHIIAMKDGALIRSGTPNEVVTETNIKEILGIDAMVISDPVSGSPLIVPKGKFHGQKEIDRQAATG